MKDDISSQKQKRLAIAFWAAAVLWLLLCFFFAKSDGEASARQSYRVTLWIGNLLGLDAGSLILLHGPVRKAAHFLCFFILGLLSGTAGHFTFTSRYGYLWTQLSCLIFAFLDEWIKRSVPGRDGSWKDVALNSSGVLTAILITMLVLKLSQRRRKS